MMPKPQWLSLCLTTYLHVLYRKGLYRLGWALSKGAPGWTHNQLQALWDIELHELERWRLRRRPLTYAMVAIKMEEEAAPPTQTYSLSRQEATALFRRFDDRLRLFDADPATLYQLEPLTLVESLERGDKDTSAGPLMRGQKRDWARFLIKAMQENQAVYQGGPSWHETWQAIAKLDGASVGSRYEYGQKTRPIFVTGIIRTAEQQRAALPLLQWLLHSPLSYSRDPGFLQLHTRDMLESMPWAVSLDFKEYGPSTSYQLWLLAYHWLRTHVNPRMADALYRGLVNYLPAKVYWPEPYGTYDLLAFWDHGGVTGQPMHNCLGGFAAPLVIEHALGAAGLRDAYYTGMLDDQTVFVRNKRAADRVITEFVNSARKMGGDSAPDKCVSYEGCAYMQKTLWGGNRPVKAGARWLGMLLVRENPPPYWPSSPYWPLLTLAAKGALLGDFWYDMWAYLRGQLPSDPGVIWEVTPATEREAMIRYWLSHWAPHVRGYAPIGDLDEVANAALLETDRRMGRAARTLGGLPAYAPPGLAIPDVAVKYEKVKYLKRGPDLLRSTWAGPITDIHWGGVPKSAMFRNEPWYSP